MTAYSFKAGFRAPPKPVGVKPVALAPSPIPIVQTAANRASVAADPDIVLIGAEYPGFTMSHRFQPAAPPATPPYMISDIGALDEPTDRPRCIPAEVWLESWPDDRRVWLVAAVGRRVFAGQPPVQAFRAVVADIEELRKRNPPPAPSEEEVTARRAADVRHTREATLAGIKRAIARADRESHLNERDLAGEQRILAYKLPEDGPAYWERGDRYPRPDEVDMTAAKAAPLPAPWTKQIKHRI